MFVHQSMTTKVVTIDENTPILEARRRMAENGIRHLPVVDAEDRLIGIVTDRDLRSALPLESLRSPEICDEICQRIASIAEGTVAGIMSRDVLTIGPHDTIEDTLLLFQQRKVGAFPVVDEQGRLEGIISVRDLLRAFINVLGIGQPGTLLCILVEEQVGQLKRIVDAITEEGISFGSVLVARYWDENKRAVFPYLLTNNVGRIKRKLTDMGYELLDPMQWYIDQLPRHERSS